MRGTPGSSRSLPGGIKRSSREYTFAAVRHTRIGLNIIQQIPLASFRHREKGDRKLYWKEGGGASPLSKKSSFLSQYNNITNELMTVTAKMSVQTSRIYLKFNINITVACEVVLLPYLCETLP